MFDVRLAVWLVGARQIADLCMRSIQPMFTEILKFEFKDEALETETHQFDDFAEIVGYPDVLRNGGEDGAEKEAKSFEKFVLSAVNTTQRNRAKQNAKNKWESEQIVKVDVRDLNAEQRAALAILPAFAHLVEA